MDCWTFEDVVKRCDVHEQAPRMGFSSLVVLSAGGESKNVRHAYDIDGWVDRLCRSGIQVLQ